MQRKYIIIILIVLFSISVLSSSEEKAKPNVIFILADDLGWKDLGCYGTDYYETPNVDALAKSGMRFTNAYTASPLCSPTRASILTGQEPGRLRFTTPSGHVPEVVLDPKENFKATPYSKTATPETRTRLPNEYLTFAEVLKATGYSTAFMGKWHLGREPYIPENQGFDFVVGGREHPGPPPPGYFFSPWDCPTLPVVPEGTHISDVVTDEAIKYIKAQKDNPFLLCLWYYDVHAPFQSKEDLKSKYEQKLSKDNIQRCATMGGMIENMDMNIGRVLQALKELDLDENTIIVFTSDNGGNMYDYVDGSTPTNNFPLRAGKGSNYEGGVRVPQIVRVPGLTKPNSVSEVITSTVDHYSTLLELLDIPFPNNVLTDGYSYVKALEGESYQREPIYSTFCHNVVATGNRANISMREGPWRLYKFYYDGANREHRYELYNLDEDISELINLADKMPDKVKEMSDKLDAHVIEAKILVPQKNENYSGNVADAWQGNEDTEIKVEDKILSISVKGNKPEVETVFTPNVLDDNFYLKFEMKSDANSNGNISWKVAGEKEYQSENNKSFRTSGDNNWNKYKVPISLKGKLTNIKIQPISEIGNVEIKNIELISKDGYYLRDWPLY